MNHDREHKVHRLLGLASLFERDPETRAHFTDLGLPDDWIDAKARLIRELAASIGAGDAVS